MEKSLIPKVPIVGLTAFTSNEDIEKCKMVGMHSILHKPLEIDKFNDIL
jgi:CheY-like chemotaxis protein